MRKSTRLNACVVMILLLACCGLKAMTSETDVFPSQDSVSTDEEPIPDYSSLYKNIVYPEIARKASISGPMIVKALVDSTGKIVYHSFKVTLGPLFEKAVSNAIPKMRFTPAKLNNVPCSSWVEIPLRFIISEVEYVKKFNFHEQVLACLTTLMSLDKGNRADYLYARGRQHFNNGEFEFAQADYDEYMALPGENKREYFEEDILRSLTTDLWKDSLNVDSMIVLGEKLSTNNLYDLAVVAFTMALSRDSGNPRALFGRGRAHLQSKNYEHALADYAKLMTSKRCKSIGCINLGWIHYKLGKQTSSIQFSDSAIVLEPTNPIPRFNKALAYLRLAEVEKAKELYQEALRLDQTTSQYSTRCAIRDIKDIMHDRLLESECTAILKEVFRQKDSEIQHLW
jgi:tetratricopeptide (TPR) repeat protein